jgi:hypothetical protein
MAATLLAALVLAAALTACPPESDPEQDGWTDETPAEESGGTKYTGMTDDGEPVELVITVTDLRDDSEASVGTVTFGAYIIKVNGEEVSRGAMTEMAGEWDFQPEGVEMFSATAVSTGVLKLSGPITETLNGEDISELVLVADDSKSMRRISLSVIGGHIFPPRKAGYLEPGLLTVKVTNAGELDTGVLTVALSGTGAHAFNARPQMLDGRGPGGTVDFTVKPVLGLEAGVYTATVTVSGQNVPAKTFLLRFTVEVAFTYGITLSRTEPLIFEEASVGYDARQGQTVVITNTGNQPTGILTVALTGEAALAFTSSARQIASIAAGDTATFAVAPALDLPMGDYGATVAVSGANIATRSFDVGFAVVSGPVYGIRLSRTGTLVFDNAVAGYGEAAAEPVIITNTGNRPTGSLTIGLTGANPSAFTLSRNTIAGGIAEGGEVTFAVAPAPDLPVGIYSATVTVSGTAGNGATISASFNVTFTSTFL